jgi:flavin-dependent dehydrogenase
MFLKLTVRWNIEMEQYDVVIIGAGLAGLQCALQLSRGGASVLLIDRKASLADAIHTTGIFVRRTLEDFEFPEDCLGPPVRHVTLYSPARRAMMLESQQDEFRVGRMGQLYLRLLDQCRAAGVCWMPGTRYAGLEMMQDHLVLRLEGSGFVRRVRALYLVGGDGAQSRVARDLGLDVNREMIVGVEEVWRDVPLEGPPRFHCFLDPRLAPGYLAWVVHDGCEVHLGVGGYAALFDPLAALEKFRASVAGIVDLKSASRVERRGGRIPVGGVLPRIANTRGLLIGDAAGAVSPLTAGGLDPCMRLSHVAARVIGDYLKTGESRALAPYSGQLYRSRFISRLWMRRVAASIRQPALLEIGCALMRLPLFNSIAWHVFFGRGSFPDVSTEETLPLPACKSPAS